MDPKLIRNFSIIAHIDHGKSTLADRMLEVTGTIEARKMRDQVLDSMELERERGITIKMQPVRMLHTTRGQSYQLNLIDTPGHIDFSYEVSRALKAVEGSLLLVDATQGVQAQTLTTLEMARSSGLVIIPVMTKVDSQLARPDDIRMEIAELLDCDPETVLAVSGRTGEGVSELLQTIIERIPAPIITTDTVTPQGLIFDFSYSNHKGVIIFTRLYQGKVKKGDDLIFTASKQKFSVLEVGVFTPDATPTDELVAGSIGYIVTGIKQPGIAAVGDTITSFRNPLPALAGYEQPRPVVWASIYPESQDDFDELKLALGKLRLSDSSFSYEEEVSGALGRGYRCGFLGMLHLEIITERLRREFNLELIVTIPSTTYEVTLRGGKLVKVYSPHLFPDDGTIQSIQEPWVRAAVIVPLTQVGILMPFLYEHEGEVLDVVTIPSTTYEVTHRGGKLVKVYSPHLFPDDGTIQSIQEPWVRAAVIVPLTQVGILMPFLYEHEGEVLDVVNFAHDRSKVVVLMPLREMMRNFFDELKSLTSGYGSVSYEIAEMRSADVTRMDVLIGDELQPAFTRIVSRRRAEEEAETMVDKLEKIMPRQQVVMKIQTKAFGRIIASRTLKAFRKDVTGHLYGGDVSRKNKLLDKQKKGKKKMREHASVNIPHDVFIKVMRNSD
jgi:GTP-binding protein LepA